MLKPRLTTISCTTPPVVRPHPGCLRCKTLGLQESRHVRCLSELSFDTGLSQGVGLDIKQLSLQLLLQLLHEAFQGGRRVTCVVESGQSTESRFLGRIILQMMRMTLQRSQIALCGAKFAIAAHTRAQAETTDLHTYVLHP